MAQEEDGSLSVLQIPLTMKYMVLPKLSVLDLYNLSHVSSEAKSLVKDYARNKNYRLKVNADYKYNVSLLNSDNQGFDVTFENFDRDANYEFYLGDFPVLTRKEVTGPNRIKIRVFIERLGSQWNRENVMKSFIAHLSNVFTKDVCIHIGWDGKQKKKIIIGLVKDLNLNVHCFNSDEECSLERIDMYPKCKRLRIARGNVNARQMKALYDEWVRDGTLDYLEVTRLPKGFNINYVMRTQDYTTTPHRFSLDNIRNYSITRADRAAATVTFTPDHTKLGPGHRRGIHRHYVNPKFVIKCQRDQQYFTCFET